MRGGDWLPLLLSALAGAGTWGLAMLFGRVSEAWDASLYWSIALPLLVAVVGLLAWRWPRHAWRLGFAAAGGQALLLVLLAGEGGSLMPLGLLLLLALGGLLAGVASQVARWAGRRES